MEDTLSIKVTIGNRVYPLTIKRDEEEQIRRAAKKVNDNMKELENNYAVRDKQDLLAMTALYYSDRALSNETKGAVVDEEVSSQLNEVRAQLDSYLENKK
jgi:cell division protein ZapA